MNEATKLRLENAMDFVAERVLEHGSMSAYCVSLVAIYDASLPYWARTFIFLAATYKFLKRG